jgi:hypothetical protein
MNADVPFDVTQARQVSVYARAISRKNVFARFGGGQPCGMFCERVGTVGHEGLDCFEMMRARLTVTLAAFAFGTVRPS